MLHAQASSDPAPAGPGELDQHRLLSVVHQAAARILSEGDWRSHVEHMLAEVGAVIGVSRVVLNRNRIDATGRYEQEDLFEWDAPGVTRLLGNPDLPVLDIKDDAFQDWRERRSRGEVVQGITRELPEGMRSWLTMQGVRSALRVPVFVGKEWWGSIGFDQCDRERHWSPIEVDSLWTAAALVGIAVEHDRSRQALRRSEREAARKAVFLQAVLDGIAQGVNAFDADLNLQFANEQFLRLFQFPPELGQPGTPFSELIRHRWRTGALAPGTQATDEEGYVSEQLARWRAMFAADPELRVEERRPNGCVVDVWRRPLPDGGFVTTFTDMTDQIRMREAVLEDERRLRNILEANPLPLLIVRAASDGVVYANQRAADLFGYARAELIGRKSADLFQDPEDRFRVYEALGDEHHVDGIELAVRRADGSTFAVELTCRPIIFAGEAAIVGGLYDLTERKRAEAEIARQREALYQSEKLTALGSLLLESPTS